MKSSNNQLPALREFANKHDCTELQVLAEKYTRRHFLLVSKGDQFVNMSLEQLKNLIGDDGLQVGLYPVNISANWCLETGHYPPLPPTIHPV